MVKQVERALPKEPKRCCCFELVPTIALALLLRLDVLVVRVSCRMSPVGCRVVPLFLGSAWGLVWTDCLCRYCSPALQARNRET